MTAEEKAVQQEAEKKQQEAEKKQQESDKNDMPIRARLTSDGDQQVAVVELPFRLRQNLPEVILFKDKAYARDRSGTFQANWDTNYVPQYKEAGHVTATAEWDQDKMDARRTLLEERAQAENEKAKTERAEAARKAAEQSLPHEAKQHEAKQHEAKQHQGALTSQGR